MALFPGLQAREMNFAAIGAVDEQQGYQDIARNMGELKQIMLTNNGQGTFRSFSTRNDMPDITEYVGVVYMGMLKGQLHWINGEKGLPVKITDKIYQMSAKVRFENFVPTQTPAMGVPRMARRTVEEVISKCEKYSLSFPMEGEHFFHDTGNLEMTNGLMAIAGNMAMFMAREAYRHLHFCQSIRGIGYQAGRDENSLILAILSDRDLFAMPHKHDNGLEMIAEHASTMLVSGPAHLKPDVAIFPMGKIGAMAMRSQLHTEYYKSGPSGPKRLRSGVDSDLETGEVKEGSSFMLLNGVQVFEGPTIEDLDNAVQEFNRETYTGDFIHFTTPQDGHHGIGDSGEPALPWIRAFSASDDQWTPVNFEEAFMNCGRFRKIRGGAAAGDVPEYNPDPDTHLWELDPQYYLPLDENVYPQNGVGGNNDNLDPFAYVQAGNVVFRSWCEPPTRDDYTLDLPQFYNVDSLPKYSTEELIAHQRYIDLILAAGAAGFVEGAVPAGWDYGHWYMEVMIQRRRNWTRWNARISLVGQDAANNDANVGPDAVAAGGLLNNYRYGDARRARIAAHNVKGRTMREWSELVEFLLFRGAVGTRMQDIPFYKSGRVGNTYHGETRYNMAQNVNDDMWLVRADCRIGIHIYDDNAVCVARNSIYHGIISGSNARIMTVQQAQTLKQRGFAMDPTHPAMHAICIPKRSIRWNGNSNGFDNTRVVIATAGTFPVAHQGQSTPHYPGHRFYGQLYGFNELAIHDANAELNLRFSPALLRGGVQYPTKSGFREERSQGHHGPEAPGVRETRMTGRRLNPILI
jgi:hypothetical protein